MTFRAKPVTRTRRDRLDAGERRNLYLNIAFGVVVVVAVLILFGAVFASWYGDHLAAMVSVNGSSVSKDFYRDAVKVNTWRLDQQEARIRERVAAGQLNATDGQNQIDQISQQRQSITDLTYSTIVDGLVQAGLAKDRGVAPTPADIDAAWTKEATTPEARKVYLMTITPGTSTGETKPSQAEIAAAQTKANDLKALLDKGTKWEDVVNQSGSGTGDGLVGWVTKGASSFDTKLEDAVFALQPNSYTAIVTAPNGSLEIGRVTDVAPAKTDAKWGDKVSAAGLSADVYRTLLGYSVTTDKLTASVIGDVVGKATPQRDVQEILINTPGQSSTGDQVRVRMILFSPNHDPQKASSVKPDDPAWTKAHDAATQALADIRAGKVTFADAAKKSDDTGSGADGGLLPWLSQDQVVPEFGSAIFKDGLTTNQILDPVKTQYGWHIIQFVDRRPPADKLVAQLQADLAKPGADFAALAQKYSDGDTAKNGGAIGWVARLQLQQELEDAIFAAPVGGISAVLQTSKGSYIFKVLSEQTRMPDDSQVALIKGNGFQDWYSPLKAKAKIDAIASPAQVLGTSSTQ